MCRRAGKLAPGDRAVREGLARSKLHLILVAQDAGRSTKATFTRLSEDKRIPCMVIFDRNQLGTATGYGPKAVLGIADQNLAAQIINLGRRLAGHSEDGRTTGVD